jgi:hypothetical protein
MKMESLSGKMRENEKERSQVRSPGPANLKKEKKMDLIKLKGSLICSSVFANF